MSIGRLHILTDRTRQKRFSHPELAARALAGGADTIQFRQKRGPLRAKRQVAYEVVRICIDREASVIINDHIDIAQATGATGVHLGQGDAPLGDARRVLGPDAVIGATATTAAQAEAAEAAGADYIGFGPVFPTASKANPASVKGLDGLAAACRATGLPVIAIAGITPERVRSALEAGAHGVAVLSGVVCADDPGAAAARYRSALDDALRTQR